MKIQILSDLHLEHHPFELPIPEDSKEIVLVLLGDIGCPTSIDYTKLLVDASKAYRAVIVIAGNHEYYTILSLTMEDIKQTINDVVSITDNVYFLDNSAIQIDDVLFVGTTLWSSLNVERCYDLNMITDMTLDKYNDLHQQAVNFVETTLEAAVTRTVVLSHHAPFRHSTLNNNNHGADLRYLIKEPIVAWCFGNSHYACEFMFNDTKIISNPVGYPGEKTGFSPIKIIEV